MNPPGSFAELQRCNACKGAVGCAVVVLILLSLPIALVIPWAFEMTPDGMKRMRDVSPNEVIPQRKSTTN